MANLRKEARGRECQIRIPGVCNGNPETVVLTHYRLAEPAAPELNPLTNRPHGDAVHVMTNATAAPG